MLVSVSAAARELNISTQHVRKMIKLGRWPVYHLGPKATRVDLEEIKKLGRERQGVKGEDF